MSERFQAFTLAELQMFNLGLVLVDKTVNPWSEHPIFRALKDEAEKALNEAPDEEEE